MRCLIKLRFLLRKWLLLEIELYISLVICQNNKSRSVARLFVTQKSNGIWAVEVSCDAMAEHNAFFIVSAPNDVSNITPFCRKIH